MKMGRSKKNNTAAQEASRAYARGLGYTTGVAAALGATALATIFALTEPVKGAELPKNPTAATKVNLDQAKVYTVAEAAELSKAPQKQIVFHYDSGMDHMYVASIKAQAKGLRGQGYYAVAIPGGPSHGAQVYIAGLTSPKLFFNAEQIWNSQPTDYAAAYYKKLIGAPSAEPLETAALEY